MIVKGVPRPSATELQKSAAREGDAPIMFSANFSWGSPGTHPGLLLRNNITRTKFYYVLGLCSDRAQGSRAILLRQRRGYAHAEYKVC